MSRMLRLLPTVFGLLLSTAGQAGAEWRQLQTPNFLFVGDASESTIRRVAERLEQFQDAVSRILPPRATSWTSRTVVLVFRDDRSMTPYKGLFNGKPVEAAGFFSMGQETNYIALNVQQDTAAYGVIYHEFAHSILGHSLPNPPLWFNEGVAELYESFELSGNGRSVLIGRPPAYNLRLLQSMQPMPLADLLAVDHSSPMYNEGNRRGLFYAQSWALTHYLTFGNDKRREQLARYLQLFLQGRPGVDAFRESFGELAVIERELRDYLRNFLFPAMAFPLDEKLSSGGRQPATVVSEVEAAADLGELLARTRGVDTARTFLNKAVQAGGNVSRALVTLARLEVNADRIDAALPLLERAMTMTPDNPAVLTQYGTLLLQQAVTDDEGKAERYKEARTAFARAQQLEPDNPTTMAMTARLEMVTGGDVVKAVALLRRAVTLVPGREDYVFLLASALEQQRDFDGAIAQLGPLLARAQSDNVREFAREAMARVAEKKETARRVAAASSVTGGDRVAAGAGNGAIGPVAGANAPSPSQRPLLPQGAMRIELRPVGSDELRVLGTFAAVECGSGFIVLVIETPAGSLRLGATSFADVEFLTYRPDSGSSIPCGAQRPPLRALATYRTDAPVTNAATPNRAVAIEVLPDGYTPR